jgi:aquaporin related protein
MAVKDAARDHVVAFIGEFVGTFLFLFFSFAGVQTASQNTIVGADPSKLLFISSVFGFSLAINVWIFFRVSGGLFNPAVSVGLFLVGGVPFIRFVLKRPFLFTYKTC